MAVTTKKLFNAVGQAGQSSTTVFASHGIELNNQDDIDVYVTKTTAGIAANNGKRILHYRQSTASNLDSNHPQVNNTDGLYFPALTTSGGTESLENYQLTNNNNDITFNAALPAGAVVFVERRTRDGSGDYTTLAGGSTIRSSEVNRAFDESNFTAQDARNKALEIEGVLFDGDQPSTNFVTTDHIVAGSIDSVHLKADIIDGTKLADNAVDSEHLADNAVGTLAIGPDSVTMAKLGSGALPTDITVASANIVDGTIVNGDISTSASIDGTKVNPAFGSQNITTTGTVNGVSTTELSILDGATVTTAELNILDGVTATASELNILDGVTASTAEINKLDGVTASTTEINKLDGVTASTAELNITDGLTATTAELNTLDGITSTTAELNILDGVTATTAEINTLGGVTATTAEINLNDGQTATAADVNILDGVTATTAELNKLDGYTGTAADLNEVVAGKNVVETISSTATDAQIPTAQAVNERITTVVSDVGGFVPIANETSFPTANPDLDDAAGTIVSIKALSSAFTTGSGVTTHTFTNGAGSGNNVTITGLTQSTTYPAGRGMLLETTPTSGNGSATPPRAYAFHRLTLDETGVANAQAAIDDWDERYYGPLGSAPNTRPGGGARVQGDLYFSTSDNQMKVWNNAASQWDDVASSASSNIVTLTPAFNGSETEFTCSTVPVDAQSLLLSINGVIQKPNTGTSTPSEGFVKLANGKIKLGSAPASGAPYFAVSLGNTVSVGTPSPDTVGATELKNGEIANVHISSSAAIAGTKISPNFGSQTVSTTGDLTIDTDTLHVDSSNDRVGINTTSPTSGSELDVNGKIKTGSIGIGTVPIDHQHIHIESANPRVLIRSTGTNAAKLMFGDQSNNDAGVIEYAHSSDMMGFSTGTVERMRIDSSGRLMLGTTSVTAVPLATTPRNPQAEIVGSLSGSNHNGSLSLRCTNDGAVLYLASALTSGTRTAGSLVFLLNDGTDYHAGARIDCANDDTTANNDTPGRLVFLTTADGESSPTERMRIDSSGRVMLGQTSSVVPFMITATASNYGGENTIGVFGDATSYASGVGGGITFSGKYNSAGNQVGYAAIRGRKANATDGNYDGILTFAVRPNGSNMTERMRIDSSGHMGLGVTPDDGWPSNGDFRAFQLGTGACVFGRGSGDEDRGGFAVNYYATGSGNKFLANGHANLVYLNDGNIDFYTSAQNTSGADADLSLIHVMNINPNKNVEIKDGNLVIGTAGHGIDFSATANASQGSASNHNELLDDYEEGRWSPGIDKASASMSGVSYSNTSGTYTKIGRMVTVWFDITVTGGGTSGSGAPYITELPFAALYGSGSGNQNGGYGAPQFRDMTLTHGNMRIYGNSSYVANSQIYLQQFNSSGTTENSSLNGSGRITGQATYFTT